MSPSHSASTTLSSPPSSSFRNTRYIAPESTPFLSNHVSGVGPDEGASDTESDPEHGLGRPTQLFDEEKSPLASSDYIHSRSKWRIPLLRRLLRRSRNRSISKLDSAPRPSFVRRVLRLVAILLMLLGLLNLVTAIIGVGLGLESEDDYFETPSHIPENLRHWPTDSTADIQTVRCHSHNDYWRKEPLFSALEVGCESVEADVWLHDNDLYVGHSAASLTHNRTLRSLYVNPILDLLDKQNPVTEFHPRPDTPRNGIFDTAAEKSLILLIDFKTDGEILWSHVSSQLEPLRQKKYLTHFNGKNVVQGPITIVVTGNAPWDRVVADTTYRDMFFDAPLDLMASLDPSATDLSDPAAKSDGTTEPSRTTTDTLPQARDQGQGRSGAAPLNPALYSASNSYYASVSFKKVLFHNLPLPLQYPIRSTLTDAQMEMIRAQIRGAHQRGLQVRYWGVPEWPRDLREYLWRVLISEGVDYLNVDDVREAKNGRWFERWEEGAGTWWGRRGRGRGHHRSKGPGRRGREGRRHHSRGDRRRSWAQSFSSWLPWAQYES